MPRPATPSPPRTSRQLAVVLAVLARQVREGVGAALGAGRAKALEAFEGVFGPTAEADVFADGLAQTLTYGLLAARWLGRDAAFDRSSVSAHMPTPRLRALFTALVQTPVAEVASPLSALLALLAELDVGAIFAGEPDPSIHFYEAFLDAYAPALRRARGVYYTPEPIVDAMVRGVDAALRERLGVPLGLADTSSWAEVAAQRGIAVPAGVDAAAPFVRILDPATGTGTFLVKVIEVVHETLMATYAERGWDAPRAHAAWTTYVRHQLLPRMHGFERWVAPYVVCHLRVAWALHQRGFRFGEGDRLHVALTSALDLTPQTPLDAEGRTAAALKRGAGVTVIVGNPPYGIRSGHLTPEARTLVARFKQIGGQRIHERGALQLERNLNDDYVKFFAVALALVERGPLGVVSLVTNRAYLDNPTLRGLRWALLEAGTISVIDLHGDTRRGQGPARLADTDGVRGALAGPTYADESVFGIQQGVAITTLVRDGGPRAVRRADLVGTVDEKLAGLRRPLAWETITPRAPSFAYVRRAPADDLDAELVGLDEVFERYANGIVTARDALVVDFDREALRARMLRFAYNADPAVDAELGVRAKKGWSVEAARAAVRRALEAGEDWTMPLLYRPFEPSWVYYHPAMIQTMASMSWPMRAGPNVALLVPRGVKDGPFHHVMVTRAMSEAIALSTRTSVNGNVFARWRYPDAKAMTLHACGLGPPVEARPRVSNLDGRRLVNDAPFGVATDTTAFYYAVALLHSRTFCGRLQGALREGFPRLPRAPLAIAEPLAALARRLEDLYDLRGVAAPPLQLEGRGDGVIRRAVHDARRDAVWINATQRLTPVATASWAFTVGDYAVLRRWLVGGRAITRRGRVISASDLAHLGRVVWAIDAIMDVVRSIDALQLRRIGANS